MSGHHRLAPSPEKARRWRIIRWLLAALIACLGVGSWWLIATASSSSKSPTASGAHAPTTPSPAATAQAGGPLTLSTADPGGLVPGSDPRVLPGPLLIADEDNNRLLIIDPDGRTLWEFPRSGDLSLGETFNAAER